MVWNGKFGCSLDNVCIVPECVTSVFSSEKGEGIFVWCSLFHIWSCEMSNRTSAFIMCNCPVDAVSLSRMSLLVWPCVCFWKVTAGFLYPSG